MNPLVAQYRSLPRPTEHASATDASLRDRKVEIVRALDDEANEADVSSLLLDVLRDSAEANLARAEAIEVVGLYIDESSPLWRELFGELLRIHSDVTEDATLRSGAESFVSFVEQALEA